jgi:hypothetical protein
MKRPRPRLPRISEEMKAWSAALAAEVTTWPKVSGRSFFGFTALYRRGRIFAVLPRTRGMDSPNSLAFKLPSTSPRLRGRLQRDPRIRQTQMQRTRWFIFEVASDSDLRPALEWLGKAYEAAR